MSFLRRFRQVRGPEFLGLILVLAGVAFLSKPPRPLGDIPADAPARTPEQALEKFQALVARDDSEPVNPVCRSRLFYHGKKTPAAIVLLHGLTNCPKQFLPLAEKLAAAGFNVLIPRLPEHGMADRHTDRLGKLTGTRLVEAADEAVDIAAGLGEQVVVAGLSMSGTTAAWVAQHRPEVARVMLISPFFGVPWGPDFLERPLRNVFLTLPNMQVWWDPKQKDALKGPPYAYPQFSTRAAAESLNLGALVLEDAARQAPQAREIMIVTSEADEAVDLERIHLLAERWQARGAQVEEMTFPREKEVPHDMIDPNQPDAVTELVYPALIECLVNLK